MEQYREQVLQEIGDRISLERKKLGLTQKQLAEQIGVSEKYVTRIESGGNITLAVLINIVQALHTDPSYLLNGNPTFSSAPSIIRKLSLLTNEQYNVILQTIDQFIAANEKLLDISSKQ